MSNLFKILKNWKNEVALFNAFIDLTYNFSGQNFAATSKVNEVKSELISNITLHHKLSIMMQIKLCQSSLNPFSRNDIHTST